MNAMRTPAAAHCESEPLRQSARLISKGDSMRLIAVAAFAGLLATAAHAGQSTVSYDLKPGACTKPIAVPIKNKPVLVMGSQITPAQQAGGHVSLVLASIKGSENVLSWAGTDFFAGEERNYAVSHSANVHIMWLDFSGNVDVQSTYSTHLQVCNKTSSPIQHAIGYLTFMY
jgi:hypothetical protein